MSETNPEFLYSGILNRRGGFDQVNLPSMIQWTKDQGILWVHIDVNDDASRLWLTDVSGLKSTIVDALLADETRPRSHATEEGLLVVLRGVNTNPGDDPEDMVSIRLWIEHDRIISTRRRRLLSLVDIRDSLEQGDGPKSAGGFLAALTGRLADRIGDFVDSIEDRVSNAEDKMAAQDQTEFRQTIANLRRQIASKIPTQEIEAAAEAQLLRSSTPIDVIAKHFPHRKPVSTRGWLALRPTTSSG